MEILHFYETEEKEHWLGEIEKSSWRAAAFLSKLVRKEEFKEFCGKTAEILLLTEGEKLVGFCTYAEQDDVRDPSVTPWAGFVFTFPEYRGKRCAGKLLEHACELAKRDGYEWIHISTNHEGLYEKYGFSFWKTMTEFEGEKSRIYRKNLLS